MKLQVIICDKTKDWLLGLPLTDNQKALVLYADIICKETNAKSISLLLPIK